MLIDEEIIFAAFQIQVAAIALMVEEDLTSVSHVASYAHIAFAKEGDAQHTELLKQGIVHLA